MDFIKYVGIGLATLISGIGGLIGLCLVLYFGSTVILIAIGMLIITALVHDIGEWVYRNLYMECPKCHTGYLTRKVTNIYECQNCGFDGKREEFIK